MTIDVTRRDFNRLIGTGLVAATTSHASSLLASDGADVTWTSDDPYLSGNFLPVERETDASDLRVIAGRIPPDLSGAYMRNGPNPLFKPISYTYPMDGDGMIHAVYLDNGRARYRNRFVQTSALSVERRAGRALYGGLMGPVPVDPALVHPGENPGPYRNGAFIHVIRHGGHLLALDEAQKCYEMTMELDTVGPWKAGTAEPIRLGAHNRRHPQSGALFALAYSVVEPVVRFHQIDAAGNLVETFPVTLAAPTMIHDFVLTERHIVLLAGPAVFDLAAARSGQPLLQWRPNLGMRIGVIPLDGSSVTWLEADPFFVFHFANGFDRGTDIVIDYVRHAKFALGPEPGPRKVPALHRLIIDAKNRKIADVEITGLAVEFPRVNDTREATPTKFVYVPTRTATLKLANAPSDTFNTMLKVDTATGRIIRHDFGNRIAGEAAFIPRNGRGGGAEDNGYLAIFAFDPVKRASDFVLLDAKRIDADPVAVVRLPQRVPQGLHGTWIPRA
jgi:carotenoid cleavage dioxygenase-like enzyme